MTDKTHQMIGLTAATAGVLVLHPELLITWQVAGTIFLGSFLGSFAPDIDQPTARIWRTLPAGGFAGTVTSRMLGGHRHVSHSLIGLGLFYLLMQALANSLPVTWFLVPNILLESALIGFIAHLAADSITVIGIPLLWPLGGNMGFPPQPLHGARIITGKWFENLIVLPATSLLLVALIMHNQVRFCSILPGLC